MTKYSRQPKEVGFAKEKTASASANHLRTHFKKMREVGRAIRGMNVVKAIKYMGAVLDFKDAIPLTRFTGGAGRHALGKVRKVTPGIGFPLLSAKLMKNLLLNLQKNAESRSLDAEKMEIKHIQVNQAPKQRRRTYRAHGRIAPYMSCPCHVELWAVEKSDAVPKSPAAPLKLNSRTVAKSRLNKRIKVGGGEKVQEIVPVA